MKLIQWLSKFRLHKSNPTFIMIMFNLMLFNLNITLNDNSLNYVRHGSFVKLHNSHTWTHLSNDQHSCLSEPKKKVILFYASSGPLSEKWFWSINSVHPTSLFHGETIPCGSAIRISSTIYKNQIGIKKSVQGKYVIASYYDDMSPLTIWNVTCPAGNWTQGLKVQFYNKEANCFLSTSRTYPISIFTPTRFPVKCTKNTIDSVWEVNEGLF